MTDEEGNEAVEVPPTLVAVVLKVYDWPLVRPDITQVVAAGMMVQPGPLVAVVVFSDVTV